jgi:protein deglycase
MNVLVPLADGFEEIEAVAIIDVLRRAGINVVTASLANKEVTGSHNITVFADRILSDLDPADFDVIALPGGPGTKNLRESSLVLDFIRAIEAKSGICAAICAAPTVLGKAGVIKGKKVTCFPGEENNLGGAVSTGKPVEIDGKIITGKGPGTAVTFSLALTALLAGKEKAESVRDKMQLHWKD